MCTGSAGVKGVGKGTAWQQGASFCLDEKGEGGNCSGKETGPRSCCGKGGGRRHCWGRGTGQGYCCDRRGGGMGTAGINGRDGHSLSKETERNPGVKGRDVGTAGVKCGHVRCKTQGN